VTPADRLLDLLAASGRPYTVLEHAEAVTGEEAAAARGTPLALGGKSVVLKIDRIGLVVLVVGSDRRVDGKALRRALGVQRYRFVSPEELQAWTGLTPGEVPPFGRPLVDAALYVGEDFLAREEVVFAAASRVRSLRMRVEDWRVVADPLVVPDFTTGG
jgi:prolyl-tRNA editing enzyme YbaK/EbsC (Cys-tRNA(Pro) deacylase)